MLSQTSAAEGGSIKEQRANAAILGGAAVLTTYLGFEAGGFFPGSTSVAVVALALVLIGRVGLARDPFGGLSWRSVVAVAALALLAIWTLASSAWSHAPGRAVLEFDRVLLYLLVLVLFASLPRRDGGRTALAAGFGLGGVVLCAAAFATRTLPAVFPIAPELADERLAYPLTYWNALGMLAVLAILVCLGLSASDRLPRILRALAAGLVPLLGATLLLTFSRGAMAAGLIGLVILCAACRSRALLLGLVASGPPTALAMSTAYSATALATAHPTGPAAVAQGRHLALVVALAGLAALLLRAVLDRWAGSGAPSRAMPPRTRRAVAVAALLVIAGVGAVAVTAFDLPGALSRQYESFVVTDPLKSGQPLRERLNTSANAGRLPAWRVAVAAWQSQPLHGTGAGTYQNQWNQHRDTARELVNAHSVYLEVLSDLGLVGLALLLACLVALVSGLVMRIRGSDRAIGASMLAAGATWVMHAGVDWDWQMPVVTWWLFAAGGLALARRGRTGAAARAPAQRSRVLVMLGIGVVAVLPVQIGLSQVNLTRAVAAYQRGDCNAAVGYGLNSTGDVAARAEPYEVLGYCDARYGHAALAVAAIQNAINRDPGDWEFRYDLAVVRGLARLDPRQQARQAVALNPLNPLATSLARSVRSPNPRVWRQAAARAPLLIP